MTKKEIVLRLIEAYLKGGKGLIYLDGELVRFEKLADYILNIGNPK